MEFARHAWRCSFFAWSVLICLFHVLRAVGAETPRDLPIHVLEAGSDKAIDGAEVTASSSNEANRLSAKTDANGDAQLKLPVAAGALRIQVEKAGWCLLRWDLTLEEAAERMPLRFALRRAGNIGGVIHDERNKPV